MKPTKEMIRFDERIEKHKILTVGEGGNRVMLSVQREQSGMPRTIWLSADDALQVAAWLTELAESSPDQEDM